jgi:DNA processing protein
VVYPKQHAALYERIAKHGAVISEFMPSSSPDKYNFPIRNRIISGLCQGTLVVEGDRHSGALITASKARLQARAVFAVPGKVGEKGSSGVNALLKDGADAATSADDVLKDFLFLYPDAVTANASTERTVEQAELSAAAYGVDMGDYARERNKRMDKERRDHSVPEVRIKDLEKDIYISDKASEESFATEAELSLIDERTRAIFMSLPEGEFLPDEAANSEFDCVDIMCALTMLEVNGLVNAVPGGRYKAKRRNIN